METVPGEQPLNEPIHRFIKDVDEIISDVVIYRHQRIMNSRHKFRMDLPYDNNDPFSWPSCIAGVSNVMMENISSLIKNGIKVVFGFVSVEGVQDSESHHVYFVSDGGVIIDWLAGQFLCQIESGNSAPRESLLNDGRILCATVEEAEALGIYYSGFAPAYREFMAIRGAEQVIHPACLEKMPS